MIVLQAESTLRNLLFTLAFACVATTSSTAGGQTSHATVTRPHVAGKVAPVPFGVHEKATFKVSFSGIGVGTGTSHVESVDTVRGVPVYHLVFKIKGGMIVAHVDDTQESWLDVANLTSLRFHQNLQEVNYKRNLVIDMFPTESLWRSVNYRLKASDPDRNKSGPLASAEPLDDVSFMYWARTIPLEVGRTYTFSRYFKQDGNPVVVKVLRRQTVKVPAGTFSTIVIQPIIKTKGLFSEGGEAELYFSDDSRRMLVMMNTNLSIGSLKLQLQSYEAGEPLTGAGLPR
jgi:hypothetical protein